MNSSFYVSMPDASKIKGENVLSVVWGGDSAHESKNTVTLTLSFNEYKNAIALLGSFLEFKVIVGCNGEVTTVSFEDAFVEEVFSSILDKTSNDEPFVSVHMNYEKKTVL